MKIDDRRIDNHKTVDKLRYGEVFCSKSGQKYIKTTEYDMEHKSVCVNLFTGDTKKFNLGDIVLPLNAKVVIE